MRLKSLFFYFFLISSSHACLNTQWLTGTPLNIQGDDLAIQVNLPRQFSYMCHDYSNIGVSINGLITFGNTFPHPGWTVFTNINLPSTVPPNIWQVISTVPPK